MTTEKLIVAGRELGRAFALLDSANAIVIPSLPQLTTKRGLLDEARMAVMAARTALGEQV